MNEVMARQILQNAVAHVPELAQAKADHDLRIIAGDAGLDFKQYVIHLKRYAGEYERRHGKGPQIPTQSPATYRALCSELGAGNSYNVNLTESMLAGMLEEDHEEDNEQEHLLITNKSTF